MKRVLFAVLLSCTSVLLLSGQTTRTPHLVKHSSGVQLMVGGKPCIITGSELGNSSASNTAYMKPLWPKLQEMNLNTVLAPVYWELLEPKEGTFDFTLVDDLVRDARRHNIKLVLLWFGTWKNSMPCYAPAWVKTEQERFPRTRNRAGKPEEIVTPFNPHILAADKKAFVRLLQHLKQTDAKEQTVIMVQVENEIGMLPEARDHSPSAPGLYLIHRLVPHYYKSAMSKNA